MIYWESDWNFKIFKEYKYELLIDVPEGCSYSIPEYEKGHIKPKDIYFESLSKNLLRIKCNKRLKVYVLKDTNNKNYTEKELDKSMIKVGVVGCNTGETLREFLERIQAIDVRMQTEELASGIESMTEAMRKLQIEEYIESEVKIDPNHKKKNKKVKNWEKNKFYQK